MARLQESGTPDMGFSGLIALMVIHNGIIDSSGMQFLEKTSGK